MSEDTEVRERPETIAVCACGSPLIPTFLFTGREYYCLDCGRTYEFFDNYKRVKNTDELDAQLLALKEEFREIAEPIIVRDSKVMTCDRCLSGDQGYHHEHATDEEREASMLARQRLEDRQR